MSDNSISQNSQLIDGKIWQQVKDSVIKYFTEPEKLNIVSQQQLIQQQNYLMEEIKQKLHRSRFKEAFGSIEVLPIDSSLSNISSAYNYGDDQSLIKSKFTEQFESSLVNAALKDVKARCCEETYQTVRSYIVNNKQKECQNLMKSLDKRNKQIQEFQLAVILRQSQIGKLKDQLNPFLQNFNIFEEEKKRWKRKNDQITEKQNRIHKTERALIFKEKIIQQSKKRSERLKEFTNSIHSKMRKIQSDLTSIWNTILKGMESNNLKCCQDNDPKGCWKKDVMKKCREKLLEERNLLKQEEKQLQKQYQILQNISQQCKKLVSDSQDGLMSSISNGSNSSISPSTTKDGKPNATNISLIEFDNKITE